MLRRTKSNGAGDRKCQVAGAAVGGEGLIEKKMLEQRLEGDGEVRTFGGRRFQVRGTANVGYAENSQGPLWLQQSQGQ